MGQCTCRANECGIHDGLIANLLEEAAQRLESISDALDRGPLQKTQAVDLPIKYRLNAKQIYDARRRADKVMNMEGFVASPAFDTLLDLYISTAAKRPVSVSSACIGAACPPTTAARWLSALETMRLVSRVPDPLDKRRTFLTLTPDGLAKIEMAIAQYGN